MEEQNIDVGGLAISYKTYGQGEPVLVLHGWGKGSNAWIRFSRFLSSKGYQVVVPDLPGFGKSQVPPVPWSVAEYLKFVEDFVLEMNLEKPYIFGHSFGGGLGAVYAAHNPERAKKLMLVGAAVIRKERLSLRQHAAKALAAGKGVFMCLPFSKKLAPLAERVVYKIAGVHDYQKTSGVMRETFKNILSEDLSGSVNFLKLPVLIVWGGSDKITPLSDARELKHKIAGSSIEKMENVGHSPHLTHPAELARIAGDFFARRN